MVEKQPLINEVCHTLFSISSCPSSLLNICLNVFAWTEVDGTMNTFAVNSHSKCNGCHQHSYWRFFLLESVQYCILVFVSGARLKHFKQHMSWIIGCIGVQLTSKHSFQYKVYDATLLYCLAVNNCPTRSLFLFFKFISQPSQIIFN